MVENFCKKTWLVSAAALINTIEQCAHNPKTRIQYPLAVSKANNIDLEDQKLAQRIYADPL